MNAFLSMLSVTVASQSHRWNNLSVRNHTSHQNKQGLSPVIHYLSLQSVLLLTFPLMCLYGLFMLCQSLASFASFIYLEAWVSLSCGLRGGEVGRKTTDWEKWTWDGHVCDRVTWGWVWCPVDRVAWIIMILEHKGRPLMPLCLFSVTFCSCLARWWFFVVTSTLLKKKQWHKCTNLHIFKITLFWGECE